MGEARLRRRCSHCHGTGYIGVYEPREKRLPEGGEWSKELNHWKQSEADFLLLGDRVSWHHGLEWLWRLTDLPWMASTYRGAL